MNSDRVSPTELPSLTFVLNYADVKPIELSQLILLSRSLSHRVRYVDCCLLDNRLTNRASIAY